MGYKTSCLLRLSLTILVLIAVAGPARSQSFYQLRFRGTSHVVQRLLTHMHAPSDTVVVILVSPMLCPRCEGFIGPYVEHLRSIGFAGSVLGVINYPRLLAVEHYLSGRGFKFPVVIDTAGDLAKEINFPASPPVVTVWKRDGSLIHAMTLYGVTVDDSLARASLVDWGEATTRDEASMTISTEGAVADNPEIENVRSEWKTPILSRSLTLREDSSHALSKVTTFSVDEKYELVELEDALTLSPWQFDLASGAYQHTYKPEYSLRKTFSTEVSDSLFNALEKMGLSNAMLFETQTFHQANKVVSTASLPEFFYKKSLTHTPPNANGTPPERRMTYRNARAVVTFDPTTYEVKRVTRIEAVPDSVLGFAIVDIKMGCDSEVVLEVSKGYPTFGFSSSDTVRGHNPLNPSFYERTPLFAVFDLKTGAFKSFLGKLDSVHRGYGIGYALVHPVGARWGDRYLMGQQLVPKILSSKGDEFPLKSYFNGDMLAVRPLPTSLPTIAAVDSCWNGMGARIFAIGTSSDTLRVLWAIRRNGHTLNDQPIYVAQAYSLSTKRLLGEWKVPEQFEGGGLQAIASPLDTPGIYVLYQSATTTHLNQYFLR
ncbi:MAG: hypothetical protein ABI444_02870 [Candidatus Kapaibacterium sp.]